MSKINISDKDIIEGQLKMIELLNRRIKEIEALAGNLEDGYLSAMQPVLGVSCAPQSQLVSVDKLISSLKETDPYIETIYTQGGCYKFHLFLKSIFKDAAPYINESNDHIASLISGELWDISGKVGSDEAYRELEDTELAESWSFAGNMMLSIGECQCCEEPILVIPTPPNESDCEK